MGTRLVCAALALVLLALCAPAVARSRSPARRVPTLSQGRRPYCLPYAAAAVLQFHGYAVDPLELTRALPITRQGIAYTDLVQVLSERGISARLLTLGPKELHAHLRRGLPVILSQASGAGADHVIVVERMQKDRTYAVMDPAQPALRSLPVKDVEAAHAAAAGQAILISPPAPPPAVDRRRTDQRQGRSARPGGSSRRRSARWA